MNRRSILTGVGHYLPERIVTNSEFLGTLDTSDEWIQARSGIKQRHIAEENEKTSDLAIAAGKAALKDAQIEVNDLDAIILATSTADLVFPSSATAVQHGLGMTRGFAYDIQAVCAGFVFALSNANSQIISGQAEKIMVIGAETFSRLMDWKDRSTCVLFGDGAGAVILEAEDGCGSNKDRGILSVDLNSDGKYKKLLYVDGGVSTGKIGHLRMEGKEVFRHAVQKLTETAERAIAKAQVSPSDINWVIPHQANIRILNSTTRKLGVPPERVIKTVQDHGNTSAASIPLALSVTNQKKLIKKGDLILTEAIGGGFAWGAVVLRW